MAVDPQALLDAALEVAKRRVTTLGAGELAPDQDVALQGYIRVLTALVRGQKGAAPPAENEDLEGLMDQMSDDPLLREAMQRALGKR